MPIHLVEADSRPEDGTTVEANCGKELVFANPIAVSWNDGRLCYACLQAYQELPIQAKTFAILQQPS